MLKDETTNEELQKAKESILRAMKNTKKKDMPKQNGLGITCAFICSRYFNAKKQQENYKKLYDFLWNTLKQMK